MNRGSIPYTDCPAQVNRHSSPNTEVVWLLIQERTANNVMTNEMNREIISLVHCTAPASQHCPPNTELVHISVYIRTARNVTAKGDEHSNHTTHRLFNSD